MLRSKEQQQVIPICKLLCGLLIVVMLASNVFADVTLDLGEYSVKNPKISATYSKPVHLDTKTLKSADGTKVYSLCQDPKSEATTYVTDYELYTKTGATDGLCTTTGTNQELTPGDYVLILQASDQAGLGTADIRQFHVQGLEIKILSPASGVSPNDIVHVEFITTKSGPTLAGAQIQTQQVASVCKYGTQPGTYATLPGVESSTARMQHSIDIAYKGDLYIACKEGPDAGQEAQLKLRIDSDKTKPVITTAVTPTVVASLENGKGIARVHIDTDDRSFCNVTSAGGAAYSSEFENESDYNTYVKSHEDIELSYDPLVIGATAQTFSYSVRCKNLAGLTNTSTFSVQVNFADEVLLTVLEPQPLIRTRNFNLVVKPTFFPDPAHIPLDECFVNDDGTKRTDRKMVKTPDTLFTASFVLNDGLQQFHVSCYGRKNANISYNVTIDSTAPTLPDLEASEFMCNGSISATFPSEDANGVVRYAYSVRDERGSLASGTTGAESITLTPSRALVGVVRWSVNATDIAGNVGETATAAVTIRRGSDESCGLPPFITLRGPNLGFALKTPYALEVGTREAATCRYALQSGVLWQNKLSMLSDDAFIHTVDTPTRTSATVYISCNDTSGVMHSKSFQVGVDASVPRMVITSAPNPVIDPREKIVLLRVTTDDYTFCTYNNTAFGISRATDPTSYTVDHTEALNFNSITTPTKEVKTYDITCTNLALLSTTQQHTVIIDLGATFSINVTSPPAYTSAQDIVLIAKPNKQATCSYEDNGTTKTFEESNNTFTARLGNLPEKSYQYIITCNAANSEATAVAQFIVDRSKPEILRISGPKIACPANESMFYFNVSGFDPAPLINYSLRSTNATYNYSTTDVVIKLPDNLPAGKYTLSASATNAAGTRGGVTSIDVTIGDEDICSAPIDHCTNGQLDTGEEAVDCGGTCLACQGCSDDSECGEQSCVNFVCVPTTVNDTGIIDIPCTSDDECTTGVCSQGICTAPPVDEPTPGGSDTPGYEPPDSEPPVDTTPIPEAEESNLLSILLIAIGIAIMGGAGYFLYEQNEQKHAQKTIPPMRQTSQPRPAGQLSPIMEKQYEQNPEQRKIALEKAYQRLQAEKAQRSAVFTKFNDAKPASPEQKVAPKEESEEFVDISSIKKPKGSKEDSFDELERMGK
jgi:hypothetical protein